VSADPADEVLDPVAAYDLLAPIYAEISAGRRRYLRSVEDLIVSRIPAGSRRMLDVGAGDGRRAQRIFELARLAEVILLEPSVAMAESIPEARRWAIRAEDLGRAAREKTGRGFDVITCLWNVLGHVRPEAARIELLRRLAQMLAADGRLFLDVNHRYNVSAYGLTKTLARWIYDRLRPAERNGDVVVRWQVGKRRCATYGHVFTNVELRRLAAAADLAVEERLVVDYGTGQIRRFACEGNLLYALRRDSALTPTPSAGPGRRERS
jgi:SAM-dependent methyltransferase